MWSLFTRSMTSNANSKVNVFSIQIKYGVFTFSKTNLGLAVSQYLKSNSTHLVSSSPLCPGDPDRTVHSAVGHGHAALERRSAQRCGQLHTGVLPPVCM